MITDQDILKKLKRINLAFRPFCHGTDSITAEKIDIEGLKSAEEAKRGSVHIGSLQSKRDRIYFTTTTSRRGVEKCIEGSMLAVNKQKGDYIKDGVIYLLKTIPNTCIPVVDEDVYRSEFLETDDPYQSLRNIHSLGIKDCVIPREKLEKLSVEEFHNFAEFQSEWYKFTIPNWDQFKKLWFK